MIETFAPARFAFLPPPASTRVRTAWISDVHLGTRASGAARLLDFLREYDFEMLYIVGDLIDIWQMRRSRYWPQQHNDVIQKILRKARKGTRVIYIPGNHDEMISSFYGAYGDITIQKHAIHRTADGRRILVIHGHELDTVVQNVKWLAFLGNAGYQFLLSLNPLINFVRRRFGLGYWSLSAYVKQRVKDAISFIGKFEAAVVKYAERYRVDGVLCGHIHSAAIHKFGNVTYYNCGDWVETCSALVEHLDGGIEIVHQFGADKIVTHAREPAIAENSCIKEWSDGRRRSQNGTRRRSSLQRRNCRGRHSCLPSFKRQSGAVALQNRCVDGESAELACCFRDLGWKKPEQFAGGAPAIYLQQRYTGL